jgi:hypothetical protein
MDSLEFHGGIKVFRIKTPWYANRRFNVYSMVNSYFLDTSIIIEYETYVSYYPPLQLIRFR